MKTVHSGKVHVPGPAEGRTWCGLDIHKRGRRVVPNGFSWDYAGICGSCYLRAEQAQIRDAQEYERVSKSAAGK